MSTRADALATRTVTARSEGNRPGDATGSSRKIRAKVSPSDPALASLDRSRRSHRHSRRTRLNAERPAAIRAVCPFRLVVDEDLDQLIARDHDERRGGRLDALRRGRPSRRRRSHSRRKCRDPQTGPDPRDARPRVGSRRALGVRAIRLSHGDRQSELSSADDHVACGRCPEPPRPPRTPATASWPIMAFVLAERLDRRTQDVVSLLKAAGTSPPVSGAFSQPCHRVAAANRQISRSSSNLLDLDGGASVWAIPRALACRYERHTRRPDPHEGDRRSHHRPSPRSSTATGSSGCGSRPARTSRFSSMT